MSRNPQDLTELLQKVWLDIKSRYEAAYPERKLFLTSTYRSVDEQKELYAKGRTKPGDVVTNCDGIEVKSKHNKIPSMAFDFAIKNYGRLSWDDSLFFPIGKIIKESLYSDIIRWGGDFKPPAPKDFPHIEEI